MKSRCPSCGSTISLDALIEHDGARRVFRDLFEINGLLSLRLIKYLSLHRPAARDLTFLRVEKLLSELLPDIRAQRIERGGKVFDAPPEAWTWAIDQAIQARDQGHLKTPLKGHGWLYEVMTHWPGTAAPVVGETQQRRNNNAPRSKTMQAIATLEGMK